MIAQQADAKKAGDHVRAPPPAKSGTAQAHSGRELVPRPSSVPIVPATVNRTVGAPGQVLPGELRGELESAFGVDFDHVRVHTDTEAELSARALGASAYTVANHVVFGPGAYAPETVGGKRLIAHELAHVVQAPKACSQRNPRRPIPRQVSLAGN